ncbi:hypothetical protein CKM354_000143700 [Cercospora kikuchii]|uniref:Uncharacterized protein n=1 Tax=Cercospora kikuchii TaxID=84275 RepID=A0A9P3FCY9_9PEZI|nr:uncharacterized protein CKM354_000143700 [Cercospora kikuchii]GIZ38010.1 hypothetical protein CKM354_000143700 [Cercospora kikuchii]
MKASLALVASTAALVAAQEYTSIDTIIDNVKNITNQTNHLTELAEALKPTDTLLAALPLNEVSNGVQAAINVSIANAKGLPDPLPPADGIRLIPYIQQLSNASVDAIAAFINQRSFFLPNGAGEIVLTSLALQNATSYDFNAEIARRNPANLQGPSAELSQPIFNALAAGVTAFEENGTKCADVASCYAAAGVTMPGQQMESAASMKKLVSYTTVMAAAVAFAALM